MHKPIGIFDSGVGGLSVLREVRQLLPGRDLVYFADQKNVPYGSRPLEEIRDFSRAITAFLNGKGAEIVVVACNTASAAALYPLRESFPQLRFVGMEPAVKPAAELTRSGVVGVLATPATFQGRLFESVVERFAANVTILQDTCPGLVQQIESGHLATPKTLGILNRALTPMLKAGADTIVLGCTHYPFVIPAIQAIVGGAVRVIDPAPAVARQVRRLALGSAPAADQGYEDQPLLAGKVQIFTSGEPRRMGAVLQKLLAVDFAVRRADWVNGVLVETHQVTGAAAG